MTVYAVQNSTDDGFKAKCVAYLTNKVSLNFLKIYLNVLR